MARFRRWRFVQVLMAMVLLPLIGWLLLPATESNNGLHWAVAKGAGTKPAPILALTESQFHNLLTNQTALAGLTASSDLILVSAVRLGTGETQQWQAEGCRQYNCLHLTFYNKQIGGTIEAIINATTNDLLTQWANPDAQPSPSRRIGQIALNVAKNSPVVQEVLGDMGDLQPTMTPITIWLEDGDCATDWCVDLTFHAPDQSGRIFHVAVNMRTQAVAHTFYSRARADRTDLPALQEIEANQEDEEPLFENGCRQQDGWQVCWEMTAYDGMNFYDASYNNTPIFSSAKIGQVEVYYASWPGGYRDELGAEASVEPKFGTEVIDLDNGFEVRQTFTEPFDWPNCICCYRYTQVLTFYADGGFQPSFVAHGPGCDDPNVYRPFWRIDFDLDGAQGDAVWQWEESQWMQVETEQEISLYEDLSLDGEKLAIFDGDIHYRWQPVWSDPFGVDSAKLFLLRFHDGEGNFTIGAGEANTFHPPADWVDGEQLSGTNGVLWYIPILETKRGGPWWCMPEPAPDFSPCTASVMVKPGGELRQPTAEELAQAQPTATSNMVSEPSATATHAPIRGRSADAIWQNAGCGTCHLLPAFDSDGLVGPDLSNIGTVASERVSGMSAVRYLLESIGNPNAFIVPDCPEGSCQANIMPATYAQRLSPDQIDTLVTFLLTQKDGSNSLPPPINSTVTRPQETATPSTSGENGDNRGVFAGIAVASLIAGIFGLLFVFARARSTPAISDEESSM